MKFEEAALRFWKDYDNKITTDEPVFTFYVFLARYFNVDAEKEVLKKMADFTQRDYHLKSGAYSWTISFQVMEWLKSVNRIDEMLDKFKLSGEQKKVASNIVASFKSKFTSKKPSRDDVEDFFEKITPNSNIMPMVLMATLNGDVESLLS